MLRIRKPSLWTYDTSQSTAFSLLFLSQESGNIWLKSPIGTSEGFSYTSAGAGFSKSLPVGASWSTVDYFSRGKIFLLDTFVGHELNAQDLQGGCLIGQFSFYPPGKSGTAMLLGIPPAALPFELVSDVAASVAMPNPIVADLGVEALQNRSVGRILSLFTGTGPVGQMFDLPLIQSSAKALLLIRGDIAGVPGVGISSSVGLLWRGSIFDYIESNYAGETLPLNQPLLTGTEQTGIRTSSSLHESLGLA
jgi:hypothetical protein